MRWKPATGATTGLCKSISVTLCFKAHKSDGGELLVPYAPATDGKWWMAGRHATEVTKYADEVVRGFQLPAKGLNEADRLLSQARLQQWKEVVQVSVGALLVGWMLVAVVGWIARGFAGIPRGKDERPHG